MKKEDKYNPYDDKYNIFDESIIFKSLKKKNLEFIGIKQFYVIDKFQEYNYRSIFSRPIPYFYIKDEEEKIRYRFMVSDEEYLNYDIGQPFRIMGLVKIQGLDDIIIPTRAITKEEAIKEVLKSGYKNLMLIIGLIVLLILIIYWDMKKGY